MTSVHIYGKKMKDYISCWRKMHELQSTHSISIGWRKKIQIYLNFFLILLSTDNILLSKNYIKGKWSICTSNGMLCLTLGCHERAVTGEVPGQGRKVAQEPEGRNMAFSGSRCHNNTPVSQPTANTRAEKGLMRKTALSSILNPSLITWRICLV